MSSPSASDDHHRAVLHVELQLQSLRPLHSSNFAPSPVTVDVMTTHMRSFICLAPFRSTPSLSQFIFGSPR